MIGGFALIIVFGIGKLVSSHIEKNKIPGEVHIDEFQAMPSGEIEKSRDRGGNVLPNSRVTRKTPAKKQLHTHDADHSHSDSPVVIPSEPFMLPADLKARLDKIEYYYTNPNYFKEVYEAVSNGQDMETTIEILKEYNIYTDVVLEHMDSYEAFKYVLNQAPVDRKGPAKKYGNRVISEDPKSPEALEAGLYIAVYMTDDRYEKQTYLLGALKHHPNSVRALHELGELLNFDQPAMAIPFLKKANRLNPSRGNYELGIAYQRLGDYKTAWVHFQKSIHTTQSVNLKLWGREQMKAIEKGEPLVKPLVRDTDEQPHLEAPTVKPGTPSDTQADAPGASVPMVPPPLEGSMSSADSARPDAEHQAFLEGFGEDEAFRQMLTQDEQFREAYFKEVDAFIKWAEALMNEKNEKPKNATDFLEKELQRHLSGKKTNFDPDRITRGYEMMRKYGQADGLKRLQKRDPHLAKEIEAMRKRDRNAPKTPTRRK